MGFGGVLKKAFPFISAAASLGGPIGTMAANAIGSALGVEKVPATPDGIGAVIANAQIKDPDAIAKLQKAEQDFQATMAKLGFDSAEKLEEIAAGDRADARKRETVIKDATPKVLAYLVMGITALADGYILGHGIPANVDGVIVGRILGTLDAALITALTYYFGSSRGSQAKDDTIHAAILQGGK